MKHIQNGILETWDPGMNEGREDDSGGKTLPKILFPGRATQVEKRERLHFHWKRIPNKNWSIGIQGLASARPECGEAGKLILAYKT